MTRLGLLAAGTAMAAALALGLTAIAPDDGARASMWVTSADGRQRLHRPTDVRLRSGRPRRPTITVEAAERHQRMLGFGASMTESSAALIAGLPPEQRGAAMHDLFNQRGLQLNYLRQPLGSSDYVAAPPFASLDMARDERAILPLLRDARSRNPALRFMATPWSAPASMKTSGRLEGGGLIPSQQEAYADYLISALRAYAAAGVPIHDLTVQNEPKLSTSYPSMTMSAPEQAAVIRALDAKLSAAGMTTRIFAYDHNWDDPGYAEAVLREARDVERLVGAAFHCYDGEPEAMAQIRRLHERVVVSECSGTDTGPTTFGDTLRWQAERLLIRGPRAGAETAVTWNLALDAHGGPEAGTCGGRCNGVLEVNGSTYSKNAEYYVLGHASRFVRRGAHRIGSRPHPSPGLLHVAFRNPDGTRVLIVLNTGAAVRRFSVADGGRSFVATVPAAAVATITWPDDND